jgi:Family of unknown function (DUF5760)
MENKSIVPVSYSNNALKNDITLWITLENQLKIINEKTKKMREMKQGASERICNFMKGTSGDCSRNKLKIKDGELNAEIRLYDKKEYSPLTFTYIESCLKKIIHDEEQVEYVIQFLKENREITSSPDIRKVLTSNEKPF